MHLRPATASHASAPAIRDQAHLPATSTPRLRDRPPLTAAVPRASTPRLRDRPPLTAAVPRASAPTDTRLLLAALLVLTGCTSSAPAVPEMARMKCDHTRLQSAARELGATPTKDEDATDLAARTLVEACELPVIESFVALMWRDAPTHDRLPNFAIWDRMRTHVCPRWNELAGAAATLPYEQRAAPLWAGCDFQRYRFADESQFARCGASPLPFVVRELLRAADVDDATADTLCGALCEHPAADITGRVLTANSVPVHGADVTLDCGERESDAIQTSAAGVFVFPTPPSRRPCTVRVTYRFARAAVEVGRNAAQRRDIVVRINPDARWNDP